MTGHESTMESDMPSLSTQSTMETFKECVTQKYARFDGRARRREYWLFTLGYLLISLPPSLVGGIILTTAMASESTILYVIGALLIIAMIVLYLGLVIPALAVMVRRLHDINLSGWWYLLSLIPYVGALMIVVAFIPGTIGANRFGPDPRMTTLRRSLGITSVSRS